MGYVKLRKPLFPSMATLRRKTKGEAAKSKTEYEFRVMANPKKPTEASTDTCNKTFDSTVTDEMDDNPVEAPASQIIGFGWLFSACLGDTFGGNAATASNKTDEDQSLEVTYDGTEESSVPSMSRLNKVLHVNRKKADDVSDITSAASMSIDCDDDDDSNKSENESLCSRKQGCDRALQRGNNCAWWPVG